MRCTHCGSDSYRRNGSHGGSQRYICKDCKRAFSDKVRKFSYDDKERFLMYYLNNVGIRKAALFMGCSPSLLVKWVKELGMNLKKQIEQVSSVLDDGLPDVIEMDEIYTRIKKGLITSSYGLLILDGEIKLLHIPSERDCLPPQKYITKQKASQKQ